MLKALVDRAQNATPIECVTAKQLSSWVRGKPARTKNWIKATEFAARPGTHCLIPSDKGEVSRVLLGVSSSPNQWDSAGLPTRLPAGKYTLVEKQASRAAAFTFGWGAGAYKFTKYKTSKKKPSALVWPKGVDKSLLKTELTGTALVRDLINTPAENMGPAELASAVRKVANAHQAKVTVTTGDALLKKNFPTIHAVGRASSRAPRLIDMKWGRRGPKVTLVGKGVCFDTGGLDLKTAAGMILMKKDMGGAAHALALAQMIMMQKVPMRLRLLIPAVDNAVAGDAIRPSDIVKTRKGLTVEIGNTDAEGRLVMCDALALACEDPPEVLIDFATLTGAARIALGTELPALFCNDTKMANAMVKTSDSVNDSVWRLPLFSGYDSLLRSPVADTNNMGSVPQGGAITAALYLKKFVDKSVSWAHLDLMAWNTRTRPGRPVGGEAMGLRAMFHYLKQRCS